MSYPIRSTARIVSSGVFLFALVLYGVSLCPTVDPGAHLPVVNGAAGFGAPLPARSFVWIATLRLLGAADPVALVFGPRILSCLLAAASAALLARALSYARALPPSNELGLAAPPLARLPLAAWLGSAAAAGALVVSPAIWDAALRASPELPALVLGSLTVYLLARGAWVERYRPVAAAFLVAGFLAVLYPLALFFVPLFIVSSWRVLRRLGRANAFSLIVSLVMLAGGMLAAMVAALIHFRLAWDLIAPSARALMDQAGIGGPILLYELEQVRPVEEAFGRAGTIPFVAAVFLPLVAVALRQRSAQHCRGAGAAVWRALLAALALGGLVLLGVRRPWSWAAPSQLPVLSLLTVALWVGWILQDLLASLLPVRDASGEAPGAAGAAAGHTARRWRRRSAAWARGTVAAAIAALPLAVAFRQFPRMDRRPLAAVRPYAELAVASFAPDRQPVGRVNWVTDLVRFLGGIVGQPRPVIDLGRPSYAQFEAQLWDELERVGQRRTGPGPDSILPTADLLENPRCLAGLHRPFGVRGLFYQPIMAPDQVTAEALHEENSRRWRGLLEAWPPVGDAARWGAQPATIRELRGHAARVLNDLAVVLSRLGRSDLALIWLEAALDLDPTSPSAWVNAYELGASPSALASTSALIVDARGTAADELLCRSGYLVAASTTNLLGSAFLSAVYAPTVLADWAAAVPAGAGEAVVPPSELLGLLPPERHVENGPGPVAPSSADASAAGVEAITAALVRQLQGQVASGDAAGAEATLAEFQTRYPQAARTPIIEAGTALVRGQYAEAERLYRDLIAESPDALAARVGLAAALAGQERHGEALPLFEALLATASAETAPLYPIAVESARAVERLDLAERWLLAWADAVPADQTAPILQQLVPIYWVQQRIPRMNALCVELLAADPNDPIANIYVALAGQREVDEARRASQEGRPPPPGGAWPEDPARQRQILEQIARFYERGLERQEIPFAYNNLALLYLDLHLLPPPAPAPGTASRSGEPAIDYLEVALRRAWSAVERDPRYAVAKDTLGSILLHAAARATDPTEREVFLRDAWAQLESAANLSAGAEPDPEFLLHRGQYHLLTGQEGIADGYFRQAAQLGLSEERVAAARRQLAAGPPAPEPGPGPAPEAAPAAVGGES